MLEYASKHREELYKLFMDAWRKEKYKYLLCNPYSFSSFLTNDKGLDNTWNQHHFVSVHDGEVVGYITYNIHRADNRVHGLEIINFTDNAISFGIDLRRMLMHMFELYKFRKINFLVVIGNPIEKMYDRIVEKYNGRVVGVRKSHTKLIDNKYYDVKEYEVFRDDYLRVKEQLDEEKFNSKN